MFCDQSGECETVIKLLIQIYSIILSTNYIKIYPKTANPLFLYESNTYDNNNRLLLTDSTNYTKIYPVTSHL